MARVKERVGLRVGDNEWRAWSDVSITRSIEQVCSTAALSVSVIDWEHSQFTNAAPYLEITPSDFCQVWIGPDAEFSKSELIISGYVDGDTTTTSEGSAYKLEIRSKVADLVDCTVQHPTGVFRKQKVEDIAQALADPYNLTVLCEAESTGPVVESFRAEKTETVIKAIERLCRERGLLLFDDSIGNLVVSTVAAPGKVATTLERGRNIKSLTRSRNVAQRFKHYLIRGQTYDEFGAEALVTDQWMNRNRTLCLDHDRAASKADCDKRARWEAATRAGKSVQYEAEVAGWRTDSSDPESPLWEPNTLVHLFDMPLGVDDDLLIARVNYTKSVGGGETATLSLAYPGGYSPEPLVAKKYKRGKPKKDLKNVLGWDELRGGV